MKTILVSLILTLAFLVPSTQSYVAHAKDAVSKVKVYYFHSSRRCKTCLKIESQTKAALKKYFAKEMDKKTVEYVDINIEKNEKLAEKFEADGSKLVIYSTYKKELTSDLTNFAFMNAFKDDKFNDKIKKTVKSHLNK